MQIIIENNYINTHIRLGDVDVRVAKISFYEFVTGLLISTYISLKTFDIDKFKNC